MKRVVKKRPKDAYRRMLSILRERPPVGEREWSVYIVRCNDGSLYTGVAKDVEARVAQHNSGRGAAYTRAHRPVVLGYRQPGLTRSEALIREARIKRMARESKQELFSEGYRLKRETKARSSASRAGGGADRRRKAS